jgi:hypothetical protein
MAQVGEYDRELPRLTGLQPHVSAFARTKGLDVTEDDARLAQTSRHGWAFSANQLDVHAPGRPNVADVHLVPTLPAAPSRATANRARSVPAGQARLPPQPRGGPVITFSGEQPTGIRECSQHRHSIVRPRGTGASVSDQPGSLTLTSSGVATGLAGTGAGLHGTNIG